MKLTELLNNIKVIQVAGNVQDNDVAGIEYDSRNVKKNSVFVAIKGYKIDGHKFIIDALNRGAAAIILEDNNAVPQQLINSSGAVKLLVENSRRALAEISIAFYGDVSRKLKVIGITGTNGKTTAAFYLKNILETAGHKTGLIGTIVNYIGERKITSNLTTPEASDLCKLMSQMYNDGCKYVVMEVSSHSLALQRVHGIFFSSAVFTNITAEHLDFHETFENYLNTKKILFDELTPEVFAVYNSDDIHSVDIMKNCRAVKYSYGKSDDADFKIENINYNFKGTAFTIKHSSKSYPVSTALVGDFNAYNACAAFSSATKLGIDSNVILEGIKSTPQVPGRFEVFNNGSRKVVVDYSHTPDGLEKALMVLQNIANKQNPIYTVFGCGGNRDKQKRPLMGKIATELSDKVIITSDNPRDENPEEIIEQITEGIEKNNFKVIESREDAIKEAILGSEKNAIILIAGKGHEDYQEIKGIRKHLSDRELTEKLLRN